MKSSSDERLRVCASVDGNAVQLAVHQAGLGLHLPRHHLGGVARRLVRARAGGRPPDAAADAVHVPTSPDQPQRRAACGDGRGETRRFGTAVSRRRRCAGDRILIFSGSWLAQFRWRMHCVELRDHF